MDPDPEAWKEHTSGRDRVRMVVETLDEPASVTRIAERADVAWGTADSELERLQAERRVRERTVDGKTAYEPNPVQLLLDEILTLIDEHGRDELEARLVEHQSRLESLQADHDADTAAEFRQRLTDDVAAEEIREIRNVASTWESLETERRLVQHALDLYDDVSRLSETDGDDGLIPA